MTHVRGTIGLGGLLLAAALMALVAQGGTVGAQAAPGGAAPSGIHVTGTGEVSIEPDRAIAVLGVEANAPSVEEARAQAANALDEVIAALIDAGIPRDDLPTAVFNINPRYGESPDGAPPGAPGSGDIVGYTVTNLVRAQVDDLDRVGEIIDQAVAAGGDLVRVRNVRFEATDRAAAFDDALELAVEDATQTAERVAALTGVQLGPVQFVSVSGTGGPGPVPAAEDFGVGGGTTPVEPPTLDLSVSVSMAFGIGGAP